MAFSLGPSARRQHPSRLPSMLCLLTTAATVACGSDDVAPESAQLSDASTRDAATFDAAANTPDAADRADTQSDSGQTAEDCKPPADGSCEAGCWALDARPLDEQRGCWLASEIVACSLSNGGAELIGCYVRSSNQRVYQTPALYYAFEGASEFRSCTSDQKLSHHTKPYCDR